MTDPIRPDQIAAAKLARFPDEVTEVFNDLIAGSFSGRSAVVMMSDAAEAIASRLKLTLEEVFSNGLLNVEEVYRAAGWLVTYDKPGFNESGRAYFTFELPREARP